jgi:putative effector of murein hydrolase
VPPALHPIFIAELGVAALLVGGILAYRAYSKDRQTLQTTAGFLLIAGFACLGFALYRIGGMPL